MLLSRVLPELLPDVCFSLTNERSFRWLALTDSALDEPTCTFLDNEKYASHIGPQVVMALVRPGMERALQGKGYGLCVVDSPREVYFRLHNALAASAEYARPDTPACVGRDCRISPLASIAEKNVVIGDHVVIEEFVVVREHTVIGDHSVIRAGAKLGGHGFEFKRVSDGTLPVAHLGGVRIGENVEIQYNTCIDRALYPWDDTMVGSGSRIDDLVYIAHGVKVGKRVLIAGHSTVGGRTIIGDDAWLGLSATVVNGISVGRGARVNMGAVVTKPVPDGGSVSGNFAIDHERFIRNLKRDNED